MKPKEPNNQSFFLAGDCADRAYLNVRDNPTHNNPFLNLIEVKAFVESLWTRYKKLNVADRNFLQEAKKHFHSRFWEMYLAVTLSEHAFELKKDRPEGPEFYFLYNGRKIWVEAVTPGPGEKEEDRVPELRFDEVNEIDPERIILRFTNSLVDKRNKYNKALQKNIIAPDDGYLLAINSAGIPSSSFGTPIPLFVQAFLPFGNFAIPIDPKTMKISEPFYTKRENVIKAKGSPVPTTAFLSPEFSFVSTILHSGVNCIERPAILGDDFSVLHNPNAAHPLDPLLFQWCEQMFYQDGKLERRPKKEL